MATGTHVDIKVLPVTSSTHKLAIANGAFIQVFSSPPDMKVADDMRAATKSVPTSPHGQLIVLGPALKGAAPASEVRNAIADAAKALTANATLSAFVVETPGFAGATARAVVAGIAFMMPGKSKTFANVKEAADALGQPELVAVVDQLRG